MCTTNVRKRDNTAYDQKVGFLIATPPLVAKEIAMSTQVTEVLGSMSSVVRSELLPDFVTWFTNAAKL